jgi:hypothetical protein
MYAVTVSGRNLTFFQVFSLVSMKPEKVVSYAVSGLFLWFFCSTSQDLMSDVASWDFSQVIQVHKRKDKQPSTNCIHTR